MDRTATPVPVRGRVLNKAAAVVNGARQNEYGNPEDSFELIGKLWSVYAGHEYTPHDVAMMMALLKVARIKGGIGTEDSYTDACGYVALAADMRRGRADAASHC